MKRGRPPLPAGEAKAARYELRWTEAEKDAAQLAADAAGVPLAQWMRETVSKAARRETAKPRARG